MSVMPGPVGRLDELRAACTAYRNRARRLSKQKTLAPRAQSPNGEDTGEGDCLEKKARRKQKKIQRRKDLEEEVEELKTNTASWITFKSEDLLNDGTGVDGIVSLVVELSRIGTDGSDNEGASNKTTTNDNNCSSNGNSSSNTCSRRKARSCSNAEVEPLARLLASLLRNAATSVGWSIQQLVLESWLPAMAAMSKPRSSAFGVLFTAGKMLARPAAWPDQNAARSVQAAKLVKEHFMEGPDLMTAAWLIASFCLEDHFEFEELYAAVRVNMQGFRNFCLLTSSQELQKRMLSRFIDEALACEVSSRRREGLRAAANIIAAGKLDRQLFPAVSHQKAIDWLCYLVRKVPWWVAEDYALGHRDFLVLCVEQLSNDKHFEEAALFLRRHKDEISNHLNSRLYEKLMALDVSSLQEPAALASFVPHTKDALELGLPQSAVTLVDTEAAASEALSSILKADLVGVDMEWGSLGDWLDGRLALLQVALPEKVFLVDLLCPAAESFAEGIFRALLSSARPLVVGFSFHNDIHELQKSPWRETANRILGLCDLQLHPAATDEAVGQVRGLAWLVEKTLQRRFCKVEQRSCWLRRPLRPGQLHYAALDAFVLLQLSAALMSLPMPSCSNSSESEALTCALEQTLAHRLG